MQISVREFTKYFTKLQDEEWVEIIDKKSNKLKGVYLNAKEAMKVKKILQHIKEQEKQKKLSQIMRYAGKMHLEKDFENLSNEELKIAIAKRKNGK